MKKITQLFLEGDSRSDFKRTLKKSISNNFLSMCFFVNNKTFINNETILP